MLRFVLLGLVALFGSGSALMCKNCTQMTVDIQGDGVTDQMKTMLSQIFNSLPGLSEKNCKTVDSTTPSCSVTAESVVKPICSFIQVETAMDVVVPGSLTGGADIPLSIAIGVYTRGCTYGVGIITDGCNETDAENQEGGMAAMLQQSLAQSDVFNVTGLSVNGQTCRCTSDGCNSMAPKNYGSSMTTGVQTQPTSTPGVTSGSSKINLCVALIVFATFVCGLYPK